MRTFIKDPDSVLDYQVDWSAALADGDTITASEWIVDDDDLTVDSDTFTDTTATVWLSAGVLAATYLVTNRVTTLAGRVDDRTIRIRIREK